MNVTEATEINLIQINSFNKSERSVEVIEVCIILGVIQKFLFFIAK